MTSHDAAVPLSELLAQRVWLRALARALSDDENEADDVEQKTWLAALRSPPSSTLASPRSVTKRFAGLRSRCTIPMLWAALRASATWAPKRTISSAGIG